MIRLLILWHDFWWWCECKAGRLWDRYSDGCSSYWLDWLPAFCLRRRARAQHAINRRGYTVYCRKIPSEEDVERGRLRGESVRLSAISVNEARRIIQSLTTPPEYFI